MTSTIRLSDRKVSAVFKDASADTQAGEFSFDADHVWEIGALGPRFAGYHRSTYQEALITIVRPNLPVDGEFAARFRDGNNRAMGATHRNLIRTLGSGLFGQSLFYATERLTAERLDEHLRHGMRFSTEEVVHVGQGLCRGLLAAHTFGLVPVLPTSASVYLAPDGTVKLGDLALASIIQDRWGVHELTGTWTSLSPEKARGEKEGVAADIYSVGVILYELASGRPPFEGYDSNASLIYQILNVPPPSPRREASAISRDLERVILRCLAKDPEQRPAGPEELFQELQGVRDAQKHAAAAAAAPQDEDAGDFEVHDDQVLAEGGMGTLFRGRQKSLDRNVVIKVIRDLHSGNADFRARFRSEAELLAQVRDGHVVQVFGAGTWRGRPFYAMEFVEGVDLDQRVAAGAPLTIPEVLRIAEGIGSALAAAWKFKIIHRDIKPSNILLAADGTVKLTDFGLAKSVRIPRNDSRVIMGTVGYLSPEQARGEALDVRSDIYSLGVVLYELVAGHPPFSSKDGEAGILAKQARGAVLPFASDGVAPAELKAIITRCMATKPEDRYQSPEDFLRDLKTVPADPAVVAAPLTRSSQPSSSQKTQLNATFDEDPGDLNLRLALGLGDYAQALTLAQERFGKESAQAAEIDRRARAAQIQALHGRACERFGAKDWDGAVGQYRAMIDLVDQERRAELQVAIELCLRLRRIELLAESGEREEALRDYERLVRQHPGCAAAVEMKMADLKAAMN